MNKKCWNLQEETTNANLATHKPRNADIKGIQQNSTNSVKRERQRKQQ